MFYRIAPTVQRDPHPHAATDETRASDSDRPPNIPLIHPIYPEVDRLRMPAAASRFRARWRSPKPIVANPHAASARLAARMSPLDRLRLPSLPAPLPDGVRKAAVALVVVPGDALLFIRRAERAGDLWSGHVAFPGGRAEPSDASLLETALREVREEIGLVVDQRALVGCLPPQASPRNAGAQQVNVIPYVFALESVPALSLNDEVSEVGYVPLPAFLNREHRSDFLYRWQGADYQLPCVNLPFGRLWGMTLRMVDDLVEHIEGNWSGTGWPPPGT